MKTKIKRIKAAALIVGVVAVISANSALAEPNVKINAQWGSSNVGSSQYGPKLTAYITVTNTGRVDCAPPSGAQFVVGAYYKTLGLMKATSVGVLPLVIPADKTVNFIQQSLDDAHQALIYNGSVDFYVSSQAPGQPDLSAAVRPACNGELNLTDNNAHSVNKVIRFANHCVIAIQLSIWNPIGSG